MLQMKRERACSGRIEQIEGVLEALNYNSNLHRHITVTGVHTYISLSLTALEDMGAATHSTEPYR